MNHYRNHKKFLIFLVPIIILTAGRSWADLPQIYAAVEEKLYQGSPGEINEFIDSCRAQTDKTTSEISLLLNKETIEENRQSLVSALELFEGLSFQFDRLQKELGRPLDTVVSPPETGSPPYELQTFEELLAFRRLAIQKSSEYKKKKGLLDEYLTSVKQSLKQSLAEYTGLKERDGKNVKIYEALGQIYSLQAKYALKKIQSVKLSQAIDNLTSVEGELNNRISNIFNNLKIVTEDVAAAKKAKDEACLQESKLKEKLSDKRKELNRLINIYEIKLDNVLAKLKSEALAKESRELLNVEKGRLEARLEGLQYQKDSLFQAEVARMLEKIKSSFRYEWIAYYIDYPQSLNAREIVSYCSEKLDELGKMAGQLTASLEDKRSHQSILNESLSSIASGMDSATGIRIREALTSLRHEKEITGGFLNTLITGISGNLNNVNILQTGINDVLQLIQRRISPFEVFFYRLKMGYLSVWDRIKTIIYYPLWRVGEGAVTLATLLKIGIFISLGIFLLKITRKRLSDFLIQKARLSIGLVNSLTTLGYYISLFIIIFIAISTAGINLSQITIILGALGVGIGFGLQTIINNFISGIILLTERTIKVGDIIELQDGLLGIVEKISIRSTVISTYDGLDIIVPNSDFISNRVTTWTYGNDWRRLQIPFGVSYDSDPEEVAQAAIEVARKIPTTIEDNYHPIKVWFEGFGESSLDFKLLVWCRLTKLVPKTGLTSDYYFALFRKFKEMGIEIPFPQTDIHLRSISQEITKSFEKSKSS